MRKWFLLLGCMLLLACQQGAQQTQFVGTDITGADFLRNPPKLIRQGKYGWVKNPIGDVFGNTLKLTDHKGKPRQFSDFKGKAVALFFGYTHCPDVCPTTMADLAHAMRLMGKPSDEVQVLFVTLDPERDTKEVLAQFVPSFDSRFLGLYGTPKEIADTARNFKIYYARQEEAGKSGYTIDHSAGVYAFDKNGKIRVYIKFGQKPEEIAHDLELLI